eukprot:scaffold24046_cov120-Isochrysis_galbana.AAC.1
MKSEHETRLRLLPLLIQLDENSRLLLLPHQPQPRRTLGRPRRPRRLRMRLPLPLRLAPLQVCRHNTTLVPGRHRGRRPRRLRLPRHLGGRTARGPAPLPSGIAHPHLGERRLRAGEGPVP